MALVNMKKGKSSGWDRIPPQLYLSFFGDELGTPLLDVINTANDKGAAFDVSANTAIIILLRKPNKDLTQCGNNTSEWGC